MGSLKFTITKEDLLKSKRLEPAQYRAKLHKPYTKTLASDGQTMYYVEMTVINGPQQKDGSSPVGTKLTRVYFENSLGELRNLLQALGAKVPDEGVSGDLESIADREVGVFVTNELDKKGKMRNIVQEFMP